MTDSRKICNKLSENISKKTSSIKQTMHFRPGEPAKFLIPIGAGIAIAGVFAFPSVAYAVFTQSLFPTYAFRGLVAGGVIGSAAVVLGRYMNKNKIQPADEKNEDLTKNYVKLVRMDGEINSELSKEFLPLLRKAFEDNEAKGVLININSPGGSPVQSSIIYNEILKLKKKHQKKVVVVGEDYLTSGAYYIAAAADSIYVNPNSHVGSIGVVSSNYGFVDLAKKVGIESRVYTAGKNKYRSNALLPENKEDVEKMEQTLKEVHEDFISAVLANRSKLKKEQYPMLFSGDHWTGKTALEYGLVDKLGNLSDALNDEFHVDTYEEIEKESSMQFFKKITKFIDKPGINLSISLNPEPAKLTM